MGFEVTIYNDDLALVKDHRSIDLPVGRSEHAWEGVAQTLDASSAAFSSPEAWALEQNYRFDLVSRAVLLAKYLGREVDLVQETPADDGGTVATRIHGRILSVEGDRVSSLESEGRILLDPPGRVVLPNLPEGLLVKPSLVLLVESPEGGATEAELRYLCKGLSWKADYIAVLDAKGERIDLDGLVTLTNKSGTGFRDVRLKLVAGDVNQIHENQEFLFEERSMEFRAGSAAGAPTPQFQERKLFEYHLYALQRPTDLLDKEQKQVNLLSAREAGVRTRYVFDQGIYERYWWWQRPDDSQDGLKCAIVVDVENSEANQMGMPLPAGKVRVYKADEDGSLQFVGEDKIDHSPRGETLHLGLGQAFDLRGKRVVENSDKQKKSITETISVELRNAKDDAVVIEVVEKFPRVNWKIEESTHSHEKTDAKTATFKIEVPAGKKATLRFTYNGSWA